MTDFSYSPLMADVQQWWLEHLPQEQLERLLEWGEQQPHLYGFIINLADDFSSEEHEALTFLPLLLEEAFRRMGLPAHEVDPKMLDRAMKEHLDEYGNRIEKPMEDGSWRMPDELRKAWELLSNSQTGSMQEREDVELVTRIIVAAYEQAVPENLQ